MGRIAVILLVLAGLGMVVPAGTLSACMHGMKDGEAGTGSWWRVAESRDMACRAGGTDSDGGKSGGTTERIDGCAMVCCLAGVSMTPGAGLVWVDTDVNDRAEGVVEEQVQSRSDRPDSPPPRQWVV